MTKEYPIPKCVLALYRKHTMSDGRFKKASFVKEANETPDVKNWFFFLYKDIGTKVDPRIVFHDSVKNGCSVYTPRFCSVCGKFITRISEENPNTCSAKCTKNLPENLAKAKEYFSSKEFLEKRKNTCLKKYGVASAMQNSEVKSKYKKSIQAKYGSSSFTQTDTFKEKRRKTCLKKYGAEEIFTLDSFREIGQIKSRKSRMYKYYPTFVNLLKQKGIVPLISQEEFGNLPSKITFVCQHCGNRWDRHKEKENYGFTTQHIFCPNCARLHSKSHSEIAVYKYVKKLYKGKILRNVRGVIGRKELDIYLPDKKLAIEFNGDYYHSVHDINVSEESLKEISSQHINKSRLCSKLGIRLIHIFEYEWKTKHKKILWLLRNAIGVYDEKVYARKCEVVNLDSNTYEAFLDAYHLQGSVKSSLRLGLLYHRKLVAVMGFGKSRFQKDEFELHRFCVKAKYMVIGGFSKLLKHANLNNFISYVDIAHFTGKAYKKAGFKKECTTKPSYVYVKNNHVLSRYQCQKHKLSKLLPKYSDSLSEQENMLLNGWYKIYDCGNLKLRYLK